MKKRFMLATALLGLVAIFLTACLGKEERSMHMSHRTGSMAQTAPTAQTVQTAPTVAAAQTVKTAMIRQTQFTLTAQPSNLEVKPGQTIAVWTFNNSVPGPEIRVKQGDKVKITLKNELPEPVSLHWHGVPVPNAMDGVPGVTQNAVQPGQSFTYEFTATVPGTYWYHSHQDSVNQIDRGLYGAFIVEAPNNEVTRDYTLMLDEWMAADNGDSNGMSMGNMSGMDHSSMNMSAQSSSMSREANSGHTGHDMSMYNRLTINGKSGSGIENLIVKQGDQVRLRLINAGYKSHTLHLHGHQWKVTATDGQPVNSPQLLKDSLLTIAPGERYDVQFAADNPGQWYLEAHGTEPGVKDMKIKIAYEGITETKDQPDDARLDLPAFNLASYGQPGKSSFILAQKYDVEHTMNLGTGVKDGSLVYTINGKTFPNTDPIQVKKGDKVKVRLINRSVASSAGGAVDHPMHLHGHSFQVLSKNGIPLAGSPIVKDTINILPGQEYVIAFEANNPGDWMFHCHDLHHASAGMIADLKYTDYKSEFIADPKAGNKPE